MDIYGLRFRIGGFTAAAAATLLRVDRRTYERWEQKKARMPWAAFALLSIFCGDLSPLGDEWTGWRYRAGALWSPANQQVTPGDLLALIHQRETGQLYCLGEPHRANCLKSQIVKLKSAA